MTRGQRSTGLLPYQILFGATTAAIGGIIAVLGELRDELGISNTSVGAIVAAGFLASFVAQIALAPLADRGHGRAMAIAGISLSALALFVMTAADGVVLWVSARALLGFASGLLLPGIRRAATVLVPERAGENLGRLIVGEIVGFIVGPLIAAGLVVVGDVRTPFLAFAIGLTLFVPFVFRLPDDQGLRTERTRRSLELLRVRRLQGALMLIFGYFLLLGVFEAVMPLMFQDRGGGAFETGLAFTIFAIPIAVISPFAGRLADRIGGAPIAIAGMGFASAVSGFYGFIPGIWWLVAVMTIAGLGDGFGFTAGQVAVSRSVPEERQAAALGLMGAAEVLSAGVAAIPAAALYEAYGAGTTWVVSAVAALACIGAGWLRIRGTAPIISPDVPAAPRAPIEFG